MCAPPRPVKFTAAQGLRETSSSYTQPARELRVRLICAGACNTETCQRCCNTWFRKAGDGYTKMDLTLIFHISQGSSLPWGFLALDFLQYIAIHGVRLSNFWTGTTVVSTRSTISALGPRTNMILQFLVVEWCACPLRMPVTYMVTDSFVGIYSCTLGLRRRRFLSMTMVCHRYK